MVSEVKRDILALNVEFTRKFTRCVAEVTVILFVECAMIEGEVVVMTKLLIADSGKASLVMSTEVFKEKISGIAISVANNGRDFLQMLPEVTPDIGIVDFDLPDVDGTTLIKYARDIFDGPILLTAYLDDRIREIISNELFAYEHEGVCIEKPINFEKMAVVIDRFLISGKRTLKRFQANGDLKLLHGSGKKSITIKANLINIGIGGACLQYEVEIDPHINDRTVTLAMCLPPPGSNRTLTKLPGKICWIDTEKKLLGIKFAQLSDPRRQALEKSLRLSAGL